jgi:beta-N-acetylhexosaminidase
LATLATPERIASGVHNTASAHPLTWFGVTRTAACRLGAIVFALLTLAATTAEAAALTPQQLAGQRIVYSYHGLTPPADLVAKIKAGEAAGVILFRNNIASATQIQTVTAQLQEAAKESPVKLPLLIMTDQEGGQVRRLPGPPALSEKQIGDSVDPSRKASDAGRNAAADLKQAGINVNLAPVLDVYYQPGNFIDRYGRSYSNSPQMAGSLGADFIRAQQHGGVAATAKHFPGLGAAGTGQNTDDEPVTIDEPLAQLQAVDELPYRSAISAGVKLVMVSWATYPALDRKRPAGLSTEVVQDQLRTGLGFNGVTITDALEAGALRRFGGTANRARLAAGAGMDLLLCSGQHVDEGNNAAAALTKALRDGKLDGPAFTASVDRITALRQSLSS